MHELSLCQALISQVEQLAAEHAATTVETIWLKVGPLSGAEIPLLEHAYPLAAAGSVAEHARLVIEPMPVLVRCQDCGTTSEAAVNRLLCAACGAYRTELVSGDEMLLERLEFSRETH